MKLFKDKYRVESTRLQEWDYSNNGYYFITICTKNKIPSLGKIDDGIIVLSEIGKIVEQEWLMTEKVRENVQFDIWTMMPNHIHAIIIINNPTPNHNTVEKHGDASQSHTNRRNNTETHRHASLRNGKQDARIQNVSNIIRQFKSIKTQRIHRKISSAFSWQARFYEHIIRSQKSLDNIREYIVNNPLKWELDEYYVKT